LSVKVKVNALGLKAEFERPFLWQAGRLLFAVSFKGAFIDRTAWILRLVPRNRRRIWALRLLSLSPHYFIYQWTARYRGKTRLQVLECENARNFDSRRAICDGLLQPRLRSDMTVVDFGCGPGWLARHVCQHVDRVLAIDVSKGVLACARELNYGPNIEYIANQRPNLKGTIRDSSVNLVYSIAVIQHLERRFVRDLLGEFKRILVPGGTAICHLVLGARTDPAAWKFWIGAPMRSYTEAEAVQIARDAGFSIVRLLPVRELADIEDDVGRQHVLICSVPDQPSGLSHRAVATSLPNVATEP
jgi:SAM-dependent methyltransferase